MKFLNGILGLLLISLAYSQAKPLLGITKPLLGITKHSPKTCPLYICIQRGFMCRRINPCNLADLNCRLSTSELQWRETKWINCDDYKDNKQHICKTSCPFNKTPSTELKKVCVADKLGNCIYYQNESLLHKDMCGKAAKAGFYIVRNHRCKNAGVFKLGQKAKCGPKNPNK